MPISGIEGINQREFNQPLWKHTIVMELLIFFYLFFLPVKPDSPAGIAPEINRAYFAIGKCLYLWDYVNG